MDEDGASTFHFHNLPPELKKISIKVFPVLFHLSFWIKEKSVVTLAKPQHLRTQTQNSSSQFSHRITELTTLLGKYSKSGVTLGLDHIYLLTLFDLFALHYGSLFGLLFKILHPDLGTPFR